MRLANRAVHGQFERPLGESLLNQQLPNLIPDARFLPAVEAGINRIPRAVALRNGSPSGPLVVHPQNAIDDILVVLAGAPLRPIGQNSPHFRLERLPRRAYQVAAGFFFCHLPTLLPAAFHLPPAFGKTPLQTPPSRPASGIKGL